MNNREMKLIKELANQASKMMSDWPASRDMQKKFVLRYIENGFSNGAKAARKAGYSEKTAKSQAHRLLTDVDFSHVQKVIDQFKEIYDEKLTELSILTPTELMQFWTRVILNEEKDTQLIGVGEGMQEPIEIPASMRDKLKSSELLGKTQAMFVDKKEVTGSLGLVQIIDDIPDDSDG